MTWNMGNNDSDSTDQVAVINLKVSTQPSICRKVCSKNLMEKDYMFPSFSYAEGICGCAQDFL